MLGEPVAVCGTSDGSKNMSSSVAMWSVVGSPVASTGNTRRELPDEELVLPHRAVLVDAALEERAARTRIDDRRAERAQVVDRLVDEVDASPRPRS